MDDESPSRGRGKGRYALPGLLLGACAFLPVDPDSGASTVGLLREALGEDWVGFALLALTVALPYGLGLAATAAAFGSRVGRALLRAALCVFCFEATVLSLVLLRTEGVIAPVALAGFCAAMDVVVLSSLSASGPRGAARLARYSGAAIAGVYAWLAVQSVHLNAMNPAFIGTACAGALLALVAGVRIERHDDA